MKKFFAVVILFSFFLLPFFNVYGVHMLTHDIQRLSPNALGLTPKSENLIKTP